MLEVVRGLQVSPIISARKIMRGSNTVSTSFVIYSKVDRALLKD
jgi:hypothetical protein